ncbi:MAG: hypothetical protein KC431_23440, partial [Myxococcales bacterium]|nr:hypothetical protein [Myxococcales bacterium]
VLYFTLQAAALDVLALTAYLPLTLILVGLRMGAFVVAVGVGARASKVDEAGRRRLQTSFFAQGGVDLVLAAMVAEAIPGWGVEIQTVTMATVLVYAVLGPPLLARALDGAGESAAARERGASLLESAPEPEPVEIDARPETLVVPALEPEVGTEALQARLEQLHAALLDVRDEIDGGSLLRGRGRARAVQDLARAASAALEAASAGGDPIAIRRALSSEIVTMATSCESLVPAPLGEGTLLRIFATLEGARGTEQSLRVPMGAGLFTGGVGRGRRALRALRRGRRAIAGPGLRSVPLARLWRCELSLAWPIELWRRAYRPRWGEARLWHALFEHLVAVRADLDSLVQAADVDPEELSTRALARERAIAQASEGGDIEIARLLVESLVHGWGRLLAAVEVAGTLERPAWRSRPSAHYDAARAAVAELDEHCRDDAKAAAGRFDALLAFAHTELLVERASEELARYDAGLRQLLGVLIEGTRGMRGLDDSAAISERAHRSSAEMDGLRAATEACGLELTTGLADALARVPELLQPSAVLASSDADAGMDPERTV